MTRAELIAALEAAPGPSDELDRAIMAEVRGDYLAYTSSIDAVLTLVPGGYCWRVQSAIPPILIQSWATCGKPGEQDDANGATPALALCIAALKAMEGKDG